jgi:hypothetical protein
MAKYVGSGAPVLGFYHIKMPETVINPVRSTKNCEIVIIEGGELSREQLYSEFSKFTRQTGHGRLESWDNQMSIW